MMRTRARYRCVIAWFIVLLGTGPWVTAAPGTGTPAPLPQGWGWVLSAGTVSGVDPTARTATVAIVGQGRLETLEGGGTWRRQLVTGSQVVHLLSSTVVATGDDEPATLAAIHPGVSVTVWGVVKPDASVLGLKVVMTSAFSPPPTASIAPPGAGGVWGAVLRSSGGMLELLTSQGARRSVIVTGVTTVRGAPGAVPAASIAPYDVVRVEGTVNSDGSVSATRIDVDLDVARAAQVSGTLNQVFGGVGGLVVDGVMIPTSPGCYFVRGSGPATFKQLAPGQTVTVYGVPISSGATLVGLRARVVVGR